MSAKWLTSLIMAPVRGFYELWETIAYVWLMFDPDPIPLDRKENPC